MRPTNRLSQVMALVFLCVLMGSILACERRQPSLIGKWQSASGETFEFFKGGTVKMRGDTGGPVGVQTFIGNYRLIDGNHVRLEMTAMGVTINEIFSYTISRDALTLKNEDKGQVSTYRRVDEVKGESSGIGKQIPEAPHHPPGQPPQPQPQPLPRVEPKTATGSFSLDEEVPPTTPQEPTYSPPTPPAVPPPQAAWGGRWPWTSGRLLQPGDLMPLSMLELELMRNEIFARHGWVFKRRDLRDYFSRQPWYSPKGDLSNREQVNRWVQTEVTPLEKKNIQIIVSREKALKR